VILYIFLRQITFNFHAINCHAINCLRDYMSYRLSGSRLSDCD